MKIINPKVEVEKYDGVKIMKNIERACRTCYRSENLITEDSYKRLLTNCLNRGHQSILEHEKITVRMICDIGVYKDLTRHRFGSFSIESSRYCAYNKDKFGNEIKFIKPVFFKRNIDLFETDEAGLYVYKNEAGEDIISDKTECLQSDKDLWKSYIWYNTMKNIETQYMAMSELGAKPDELRMILPHSTAAEVTMTANIREWRHILDLRTKKMAHPSVRQILIPLLLKFKADMPELFSDIEYDTEFPKEKYAEISDMED